MREPKDYPGLKPLPATKELYDTMQRLFSQAGTQGGLLELEGVVMAVYKALQALHGQFEFADQWWWAFGEDQLGHPKRWLKKSIAESDRRGQEFLDSTAVRGSPRLHVLEFPAPVGKKR